MLRFLALAAAVAAVLTAAGSVGSATAGGVIVFPATPEGSYVPQLFAVMPSGAGLTQLTTGSNAALNPSVSHGGTRIAFARFGFGIFTINADGSGLRRLTTNGRDAYPTWSPTGMAVAFVRPVGSSWRLFIVSSKGGKPRMLWKAPAPGRPTWTTKGLLIPTAADLVRVDPKNGRVLKYYTAEVDAIWGLNSVAISAGVSNLTYVGTREPIPGDMECGDGPCQRYGLFLESLTAKRKKAHMIVKDTSPAAFSPDGKHIVYVAGGALVMRALATGETTVIPTPGATPAPQGPAAWR